MDIFQQAYDIAKEVNDHGLPNDDAQVRTIGSIGLIQFFMGMYPMAVCQFELAMQKAVSNGSKFDGILLCQPRLLSFKGRTTCNSNCLTGEGFADIPGFEGPHEPGSSAQTSGKLS